MTLSAKSSLILRENKAGFGRESHILKGTRVSLVVEHLFANPKSPVRFRAWSHTRVMDYDEAFFMYLTPGVVHNFPKAVGV